MKGEPLPSDVGSIFVNYRRSDEPGYVRALVNDLHHHFGRQHIFLDLEKIEAGRDFVQAIQQAVGSCEILLAVIGPSWLTAVDELGNSRIQDPNDWVAVEIASALNLDVPVIPVLVNGARMPDRDQLPLELKDLASRQSVAMSHASWEQDMQNLIVAISNHTLAPRLARQYEEARKKLNQGHWKEALRDFEAIESIKQNYADITEVIQPLRDLSQRLTTSKPAFHQWQRFALKYPLSLLLAVTVFIHVLATLFNFLFNRHLIVIPMQLRGVEEAVSNHEFYSIVINLVLFPIGVIILAFLIHPVAKGIDQAQSGLSLSQQRLSDLRRRSARLGHLIAMVGLGLWISCGPILSLSMGALNTREFLFFISSLAISGLSVAAYPFLLVTFLSTHFYYQPLIYPGLEPASDLSTLEKVDSSKWRFFILTGALPMLIVSLGLFLGAFQTSSQAINALLGIAGLIGLAGFLMALKLSKAIENDLKLLRQILWACGKKSSPKTDLADV